MMKGKMKIVIVGSESFIGQEVRALALVRKLEVIGLDIVPSRAANYVNVDLRSSALAGAIPENADAVIHLAAVSRDSDCRKNVGLALDVNVLGTQNLICAAQARKVKQFIFASSEWVYGNAAPGTVQKEDTVIDAAGITSEYALTKIVGERLLAMACQRGCCPATVLRFGIVYGPRPKPMSAVEGVFNEVRTLDRIEIKGSLASGRRFVHVRDIAAGVLCALGRTGYEVFNLSGNTLITMRDIIQHSKKLLGRDPAVIETDPKQINVRNPDNSKARRLLGWEPRIDLDLGLTTLKDYWAAQGSAP